jgi:hypothetical protein
VKILRMLEERVLSPNEISRELSEPLGNVSYHVRTLHKLRLIELVRKTPRRGAIEHHYRAIGRATVTEQGWGGAPGIVKQVLVSSALAHLGEYVARAAGDGGFDRADAHLTRTTLRLDEQGWKDLTEVLMGVLETTERLERESGERLADDPSEARDVGMVLMQFEAADDGRREAEEHAP